MLDTYSIYKQLRRDGVGEAEAEAFVEVVADSYRHGFNLDRAVRRLEAGGNSAEQAQVIAKMIADSLPASVGGNGPEGGGLGS